MFSKWHLPSFGDFTFHWWQHSYLLSYDNIVFLWLHSYNGVCQQLASLHSIISNVLTKGVHGTVWCSFGSFLEPHFVVRFSQNYNYTAPQFCSYMCGVVQFGGMYIVRFGQFWVGIFLKMSWLIINLLLINMTICQKVYKYIYM